MSLTKKLNLYKLNNLNKAIIKVLQKLNLYKTYVVPNEIKQFFFKISDKEEELINNLVYNYCHKDKYSSERVREGDMNAISFGRLNKFRNNHIPFLIEKIGLKGKKILEIGSGSGASSVALSEQGGIVTGIDVDEKAINFAKKRSSIYGQDIEFLALNAVNIDKLHQEKWDIIIYFASLDHMTPSERKTSLSKAYSLLSKGGHLCVFGTPNRLWPMDIHTSFLPFYMWLQDEIALDYSKFSPRKEFKNEIYENKTNDYKLLYRWGRGVSFHEFHSAIGRISKIKVVGSLPIFLRRHSFIQKISYKNSLEFKYTNAIKQFGPKGVHPGFYECYLDLIIEKQ